MRLISKKYTTLATVREALALTGYGLHPDDAIILASRFLEADRPVSDEDVARAEERVCRARTFKEGMRRASE